MASSYSTDLKLELMVTGENAGTWGDKTNTNLNLVQQAIAGVESIALTDGGTVTLVMSDAAISNARNMVLKLTGTLTTASNLAIPDSIEKFYIIDATAVTGPTNLTVKTVSGSGFTLDQAKIYACYTDGTDVTEVSLDTLGGSIGTAGIADASVTTAKISDNAVTTAKISDNQVTTAKISDNQITTAKISDNQITTAKISDNQVTAAKLDDVFGGTPGEFTAATVTVDAQGRITAASSGAAGAGGFTVDQIAIGPTSGTIGSNASRLLVYGVGGGGGGGGRKGPPSPGGPGEQGGNGGFAIYSAPISAPFSQPYSVGAGGNGGTYQNQTNGQPGNAGGATAITTLFNVNGGAGGAGGPNPGQAAVGNSSATFRQYAGSSNDTAGPGRPMVRGNYGIGGASGNIPLGQPGNPGYILVMANDGT